MTPAIPSGRARLRGPRLGTTVDQADEQVAPRFDLIGEIRRWRRCGLLGGRRELRPARELRRRLSRCGSRRAEA